MKIDSAGFYNITRAEVEAFCDTCPICNLKREGSKAQQGAKAHIQSGSFRWLWQLTVGGSAVGGNGVGPDLEPMSAMRLSLSPVGTSDGAIVVAGSVLFVLVVLGALARLCLESLRGGLLMFVEVPVAKPCCFINSWMAALMVAIWASKVFWVSCIAV